MLFFLVPTKESYIGQSRPRNRASKQLLQQGYDAISSNDVWYGEECGPVFFNVGMLNVGMHHLVASKYRTTTYTKASHTTTYAWVEESHRKTINIWCRPMIRQCHVHVCATPSPKIGNETKRRVSGVECGWNIAGRDDLKMLANWCGPANKM
jgi:hypothetical protein